MSISDDKSCLRRDDPASSAYDDFGVHMNLLPPLAATVRENSRSLYGNLKRAAQNFGIPYDLFRKSLTTNRFVPSDLERICSLLEMPTELSDLQMRYSFEVQETTRGARRIVNDYRNLAAEGKDTLSQAIHAFRKQTERLKSSLIALGDDVDRIYSAMGQGDLLVLVLANEEPIEWRGSFSARVLEKVSKAISKGAFVCYLAPFRASVPGAGGNQRVMDGRNFEWFKQHFESFAQSLEFLKGEVKKKGQGGTVLVPHDGSQFTVANHKYAIYRHVPANANERPIEVAVGAFPVGLSGQDGDDPTGRVLLPMSKRVADELFEYCLTSIRTELERSKGERSARNACLQSVILLMEGKRP